MSKSDSVHIATTNSQYYKIGDLKIGISDHFPEASNISCHVNPLNAKTVYLVQVKEGPKFLRLILQELRLLYPIICMLNRYRN